MTTELDSLLDKEDNLASEEEFLEDETGLEVNGENNSSSIYPNAQVRVSKAQYSMRIPRILRLN